MSTLIFFDWFANLDKSTQKPIKLSLKFQHEQVCKDCMDVITMEEVETKYKSTCLWWLFSNVATKEELLGLSEWLDFWHLHYIQRGGHMLFVSVQCFLHLWIVYLLLEL